MGKTIKELNKFINECIEKYDLEGHETVSDGMAWYARCLLKEGEKSNCVDDLEKAGVHSFSTPKFDGTNVDEIYEILKTNADFIETKLKS